MDSYRHPLRTFLLLLSPRPSPLLGKRGVRPREVKGNSNDALTVEIDVLNEPVSRHDAKSSSSGLAG